MPISLVILQFRAIKLGLLVFLIIFANCNQAADCTLDVLLTSQADIDEFACDAGGGVAVIEVDADTGVLGESKILFKDERFREPGKVRISPDQRYIAAIDGNTEWLARRRAGTRRVCVQGRRPHPTLTTRLDDGASPVPQPWPPTGLRLWL